jgi:hypothetical protein
MALEWLLQLDPAEQQQDDNDNQYQTQSSAGKITPGTAVIPRWESAHQKQNQENDQDGSKHNFLLKVLRIQSRSSAVFVNTPAGLVLDQACDYGQQIVRVLPFRVVPISDDAGGHGVPLIVSAHCDDQSGRIPATYVGDQIHT